MYNREDGTTYWKDAEGVWQSAPTCEDGSPDLEAVCPVGCLDLDAGPLLLLFRDLDYLADRIPGMADPPEEPREDKWLAMQMELSERGQWKKNGLDWQDWKRIEREALDNGGEVVWLHAIRVYYSGWKDMDLYRLDFPIGGGWDHWFYAVQRCRPSRFAR